MSHSTLRTDLVSWWQMDDDPDDGIIVDAMGRMSLTPVNVTQTIGQIDYALEFSTGSKIYTASNGFVTMQGRSFSVMCWFMMTSQLGTFQYLFSKFGAGTTGEFMMRFETGAFMQGIVGDTANAVLAEFLGIPVLNVWHMAVMTYNHLTDEVRISVDNRNAPATGTGVPPVETSQDFVLGSKNNDTFNLRGAMGPTAIWWKVLSAAEVEALWNEGEWLTFEQTEVAECKEVACCDLQNFAYNSSTATDASQSIDQQGPVNPNCPDGYLWGGLSCVREQDPQVCSDGYYWNGERCVSEGDSVVCADGFYLSGGVCIECEAPAAPTLTPAAGQVTLNFNVADTLSYNIFRSNDGTNYTLLTSDVGTAAAESYVDATTVAGTTYYYFISVYLNLECGYTDGAVASTLAF